MGEILRDEIQIEGIYLGMTDEEMKKIYSVRNMTNSYVLTQSLTPKWAGKKLNYTFMDMMKTMKMYKGMEKYFKDQPDGFTEFKGYDFKNKMSIATIFGHKAIIFSLEFEFKV